MLWASLHYIPWGVMVGRKDCMHLCIYCLWPGSFIRWSLWKWLRGVRDKAFLIGTAYLLVSKKKLSSSKAKRVDRKEGTLIQIYKFIKLHNNMKSDLGVNVTKRTLRHRVFVPEWLRTSLRKINRTLVRILCSHTHK